MNKRILSIIILASFLVGMPMSNVALAKTKSAATHVSTAKKSKAKKTATKGKKKKVVARKERLIIAPPLLTLETAPHSGMPTPVYKSKAKKKPAKKSKKNA